MISIAQKIEQMPVNMQSSFAQTSKQHLLVVMFGPVDLIPIDGDSGYFCTAGTSNSSHWAAYATPNIQDLHARLKPKQPSYPDLVRNFRLSPALACLQLLFTKNHQGWKNDPFTIV